MKFKCMTCGEEHELEDISFGSDRPLQWDLLSETERQISELGGEKCVTNSSEGPAFFLRACLEIPIRGTDKTFTWGVWVSLSEKSFAEVSLHWEDPGRTQLGPYFGWLCTRIPGYPDTVYLKTMVHNSNIGVRPTVELEPTEHPLSLHQRHGIPQDELEKLVATLLHSQRDG